MTTCRHLAILALLAFSTEALGWGYDGHRIVGEIAYQEMKPAARRNLLRLLRTDANDKYHSLSESTVWADDIKKSTHPDRSTYRWARTLHYVNLPEGAESFSRERDCRPKNNCPENLPCPNRDCVVEAVAFYRKVLADADASDKKRLLSLKFMAHFVGDVHQPLHAGLRADRGGNDIDVTFTNSGDRTQKGNLHAMWDYGLIERRMEELGFGDWQQYTTHLYASISDADRVEWLATMDPAAWATASSRQAAGYAYKHPSENRTIANEEILSPTETRTYREYANRVIELRLKQAGVRLARTLEEVFSEQHAP